MAQHSRAEPLVLEPEGLTAKKCCANDPAFLAQWHSTPARTRTHEQRVSSCSCTGVEVSWPSSVLSSTPIRRRS